MRVYIDYNAEMPDGRFFARLARLDERPLQGQVVQTNDDDGNRLVMVVDEIDEINGLVYFQPDWSTWVDGAAPTFVTGTVVVSLRYGVAQFRSEPTFLSVLGTESTGQAILSGLTVVSDAARPVLVRPEVPA